MPGPISARCRSASEFEPSWDADALTVNPYLGSDGVAPFVKVAAREGKGAVRPGPDEQPSAGEFQDLVADGRPLYRHVAERLAHGPAPSRATRATAWLGAVVGATYPSSSPSCARRCPACSSSSPATATQGATAADVAAGLRRATASGAIDQQLARADLRLQRDRPSRAKFGADWQASDRRRPSAR